MGTLTLVDYMKVGPASEEGEQYCNIIFTSDSGGRITLWAGGDDRNAFLEGKEQDEVRLISHTLSPRDSVRLLNFLKGALE